MAELDLTRLKARWDAAVLSRHLRVAEKLGLVGVPFEAMSRDQHKALARELKLPA